MIAAATRRNTEYVEAGVAEFLVAALEDMDLGDRRFDKVSPSGSPPSTVRPESSSGGSPRAERSIPSSTLRYAGSRALLTVAPLAHDDGGREQESAEAHQAGNEDRGGGLRAAAAGRGVAEYGCVGRVLLGLRSLLVVG